MKQANIAASAKNTWNLSLNLECVEMKNFMGYCRMLVFNDDPKFFLNAKNDADEIFRAQTRALI